ncbi:4-hydroxy-tetrahydrodipicolinate synthase [Roseofilum sp. Guam]|uniref:4-hydroxy-tetrahydrodipicolinate synthase n=1 Tax=Roseofilum sp. Guam TaxID=2821502 RepID=UPI001B1AE844|nr:4-hydroxy-tetrahydrodipicolinate synthase [Roseofilum sp. Guam]MBP0028145.1 4-hydroxy-tetrahydrodipicolinate synthase [Roseofilum sp. Guam]
MSSFGRVMTAMIAPFSADGSVNYDVAQELAVHLVDNGSDSLVVCGTTGESPTLTWEEEHELFRVVKQAVVGRAKVIAGTGSNSTSEAISATQKAMELGLDGSLQVVPYYNKPPAEGLYQHFKAIAKACPDISLLLYNIPGRTGQNMPPETVARLAEIPNIVGIKEASGKLDQVSLIRQLVPPEFDIYSGDDSLTLPMLSVGGQGVVSVASHLVGKELQEMIQCFEMGKTQQATAIHLKLFPLFKALFLTTNPIPIKAALALQGWPVGQLRLPLVEAPDSIQAELKNVLNQLGLN